MKNLDSEIIDFTSIFKGYRIPIPFFLLCIVIKNIEKLKMLLFRKSLKPLILLDFWHIFTKNSIFLNVDI